MQIKILGTGSYVPPRIITNEEIVKSGVNTTSEWVYKNLGIKERHVVDKDVLASDLATEAAKKALAASGLSGSDLDLIIVATCTPDRLAPSTACAVQEKLGLGANSIPAFDINAVCSGFLYSLSLASELVHNRRYKHILIIGVDVFSKITNWSDRSCVFFGDGAGAAIVSYADSDFSARKLKGKRGNFFYKLYADGRGKEGWTVHEGDRFFTMDSHAVYDTATTVVPKAIQELCSEVGVTISDIDHVIPHQPSIRVLMQLARDTGIPVDKVRMNMDRYANTAAATIPILLDECVSGGIIRKNDLILFAAVGAGWTWGTGILEWI